MQRTRSLRIDQLMSTDDDHDHLSTRRIPQHDQGITIRQPQSTTPTGMEIELHHAAASMLDDVGGIGGGVHFTTPVSSFTGGGVGVGGGGLAGLVMSAMGGQIGKGVGRSEVVSMRPSDGGTVRNGTVSMRSTSPGVEGYWMEGMQGIQDPAGGIVGGVGDGGGGGGGGGVVGIGGHQSSLSLPTNIGRQSRSGTVTQYGFAIPEQQQHEQQHQHQHQHQIFANQHQQSRYEDSPPNMCVHLDNDPFNKQHHHHQISHQEHAFPGHPPITLHLDDPDYENGDHDMAGMSGARMQQDHEMGEPGGYGRTARTRYTMGPRGDCEKCVAGVPGHFGHWQ